MKIYKLDDEILDKHDTEDASESLVITNLKQGVKNPNRVNVYVNNEYALSLDVKQVVDFGVKVGKEISEEELAELKNASEFGKLYQRTLEWVLTRPRSVRETRDYLHRKFRSSSSGALWGASPSLAPSDKSSELSQAIIERLLSKGYLDDRKFAEFYVENRFVKKGVSQRRLKMELIKKGISKEIIDEVLDVRDDETEILKIIARKRDKYDDDKLIQYLVRQGFSYQLVRNLVLGKD